SAGGPDSSQTGYAGSTLKLYLEQGAASGSLLEEILPPPLNAFFGVTSHASATIVTLGSTRIAATGAVSIESASTSSAVAKTPGMLSAFDVGVTYAESNGTSVAELGSGTSVSAGGEFTLLSQVDNTMQSEVSVESGTISPMGTAAANSGGAGITGVKIPGPAISVAYGKARSTSQTTIAAGATVTAGGVDIEANNSNDFEVSATSTSVAPGLFNPQVNGQAPLNKLGASDSNNSAANQGQGAGIAVSDLGSSADTQIDGSVVDSGSGTVQAESVNTTDDTLSNSVIRNSEPWETKKANLGAVRQNTGQFGLSAAITYVTMTNDAEAHIGASAQMTVAGSLTVLANAQDPIRASAIGAGMQESKVAIGGAVSIAQETNTGNASIDSNLGVNVGGSLTISGQSAIPLAVLPIKQYQQLYQ
ncbi:MAG: hypothetical protein ACRDLR_07225, partial [Gaiellaceae bacterium]